MEIFALYAPIKTIISPTSTTKDIEIITIDKVNFLHFRDELAQLYPEYKEKNKHIAYHDSLHDVLDAKLFFSLSRHAQFRSSYSNIVKYNTEKSRFIR